MLRRCYEADWERKKNYLIRSLFHDNPELSTIRESEELSSSPPHTVKSAVHEDIELLPDLIIERVPKRRSEDESELFYYGFRKRMRRYYRMLFNIERDGSSSPDFEDFVHCPSPFNKSGDDDDAFEPDLNSAFVKDFEADNIELNRNSISDNTNETYHLEEIQSVNKYKASDDEIIAKIISNARKTTEAKENNERVEKNNSATCDMTTGENNQENINPERNLSQLHYDARTDSESTSIESLIFPVLPQQTRQDNLLETDDNSKQSTGTRKLSLNETSEENRHPTFFENEDVGKKILENSSEIIKTVEKIKSGKDNYETMPDENMNAVIQNEESLELDSAGNKERSSKASKNDITQEQEAEQDSNNTTGEENSTGKGTKDQSKDKISTGRSADTLDETKDSDEMIIDEVEIMRSHNPSPSTQSLEVTSTSSSFANVHVERRGEIMLRHSLLSDRESVGLDVATRAIDTSDTSPEDFNPFLRCSTPISTSCEKRDESFNNSPVQHLNSEQRNDMLTTYIIREHCNENNITQAAVERKDEREVRNIAELSHPAQTVPSTMKDTNAPEIENKELREEATQTDDRITELREEATQTDDRITELREEATQTDDRIMEQEKNVVDIGVQVQDKEKEVVSVEVQTNEDSVFFGRPRITNYFVFH